MPTPDQEAVLESIRVAVDLLDDAQVEVRLCRTNLADLCREAHDVGLPDREIAALTPYSRARIQQFRSQKVAV